MQLGYHRFALSVLFDQEAPKCTTFLSLCMAKTRQLIAWTTQPYILTAKLVQQEERPSLVVPPLP